jgi:general secretion pathway protein G
LDRYYKKIEIDFRALFEYKMGEPRLFLCRLLEEKHNMNIRNQWTRRVSHSRSAGFTLIEILLVIVIILLLASALVVFVLPQQEGAEKNTTKLLLSQVASALDTYRLNLGRYPTEQEGGLNALLEKPNYENPRLGEKWQGPYVKPGTRLDDPWGHKLRYEVVDRAADEKASGPPYKLYSVGPDGQPDTDDDIRLTPEGTKAGDTTTDLDQ